MAPPYSRLVDCQTSREADLGALAYMKSYKPQTPSILAGIALIEKRWGLAPSTATETSSASGSEFSTEPGKNRGRDGDDDEMVQGEAKCVRIEVCSALSPTPLTYSPLPRSLSLAMLQLCQPTNSIWRPCWRPQH